MFLESLILSTGDGSTIRFVIDNTLLAEIFMFIAGFLILSLIMGFLIHIYFALVGYRLSKKLRYDKPWLAFIPVANFFLLPILAKQPWALGFLFLIPPVFFILAIYWTWIIFERRNYPGILSLILIIAILPGVGGAGFFAFLIILGFVAFYDRNKKDRNIKIVKKKKRN
ncbi:MAG: hypothetical protein Q8N99_04775 [Nanoarchaeota archaeon]|nr:hypothetical protein [Nanoarchaeota archaeon]